MRSEAEYIEYFTQVVALLELKLSDVEKYVKNAVRAGVMRFWGASDWSFKQGISSLAITSASDYWNLPSDFDSMLSIREENSQNGMKLIFMSKESFDEYVPKQGIWDSNYPTVATIFNTSTSQKVISLYPRPSALTLPFLYIRTTPDNVHDVPDKFHSCLEPAIAVSIYPPKYNQRRVVRNEFLSEIKRLEVQDQSDRSRNLNFFLENSNPSQEQLRWWHY